MVENNSIDKGSANNRKREMLTPHTTRRMGGKYLITKDHTENGIDDINQSFRRFVKNGRMYLLRITSGFFIVEFGGKLVTVVQNMKLNRIRVTYKAAYRCIKTW